MKSVQYIIDTSLERMQKSFFPMTYEAELIPEEMIVVSLETEELYAGWKAIASDIKDEEIAKLESDLNCQLPKSYKAFLQHKFFMQLYLSDSAIGLHGILPTTRLAYLKSMNLDYNDPAKIIEKGYCYFANFQDYGLLCFDTNKPKNDNEYEVVFMMHHDLDDIHLYANSFTELLNASEDYSNEFIVKLNTL